MPKIIAVDFDGTLVENDWPNIGSPKIEVIKRLKHEQSQGARIILWTCRVGQFLQDAVNYCEGMGIRLDAVNENLPEIIEAHGGDSRKITATEYWDDRAVRIT